ncbi:MAG: gliding motility lipoprotein GldD [Bacteroidetes bacterium]|nr:gliding motility lipoprotein GldD [Bacteroidota bacterium]
MKNDRGSKKPDSRLLEAGFKTQDSRGEKQNKEGIFVLNVKKSLLFVLCSKICLPSFIFLISCVSLVSCSSDDDDTIAPKPRSYFRLSFPEKKYVTYDSVCPFTFEMPVYSHIDRDRNFRAEPCWLNLNFPTFNGTLHLSYKAVNGNIKEYLEDTYTLASKHQIKASGIEEQLISRDSNKVYGLIYEIKGNAASSIQFFLTDSTRHFIRGALYFNAIPNTDSIAPVLEFIKKDIYQMIATFKWKNGESGSFPKAVHKK